VPASQVIAATRKPEALADLAARGVIVRKAYFDGRGQPGRAPGRLSAQRRAISSR
jgi:uncharacterized protein YbjT (DUF2867 family)